MELIEFVKELRGFTYRNVPFMEGHELSEDVISGKPLKNMDATKWNSIKIEKDIALAKLGICMDAACAEGDSTLIAAFVYVTALFEQARRLRQEGR